MLTTRRNFLRGLGRGLVSMPAIVAINHIMPVKLVDFSAPAVLDLKTSLGPVLLPPGRYLAKIARHALAYRAGPRTIISILELDVEYKGITQRLLHHRPGIPPHSFLVGNNVLANVDYEQISEATVANRVSTIGIALDD